MTVTAHMEQLLATAERQGGHVTVVFGREHKRRFGTREAKAADALVASGRLVKLSWHVSAIHPQSKAWKTNGFIVEHVYRLVPR